jgi:hypothetical protein
MTFDCPRCGGAADEDLYGPCTPCRGQLREHFARAAVAPVEAAAYEPKMNVTPNAVATKD